MKRLSINLKEAKISNFKLFYNNKDEKSYLILFIYKYYLVNI